MTVYDPIGHRVSRRWRDLASARERAWLTTAASLWVTVTIGLAVGVGMIGMSVVTTILVFLLLRFGPRPGEKNSHQQVE